MNLSLEQPSAAENRPWSKTRLALHSQRIAFQGEDEVSVYLDEHSDLCGPVESLCTLARKEFGQDAELSLSLYRDPEADDRYLLLQVRMRSYPADTMKRIQSVSDAHESVLWDKSGAILITTDFRPLR
jgi:hypothetical protein